MENHPTDPRYALAAALSAAADDLDDSLVHVRAEQQAGRISVADACDERAGLLSRHLARLERIRAEHGGETP